MAVSSKKSLGQVLVSMGLITKEQWVSVTSEQKGSQKIGELLVSKGYISDKQLIQAMEKYLGVTHVSLYNYPIDKALLKYVPFTYAQEKGVIPLRLRDKVLELAMIDPTDYFIISELSLRSGLQIEPVLATSADVTYAVNKYYVAETATVSGVKKLDESVVDLLNQILTQGVKMRASDIHFEPSSVSVRVRYRTDGQLRQSHNIGKDVYQALMTRIKVMADLDITQSRLPQDGRFTFPVGKERVDLRVSTLPTVTGEKIVVRILDMSEALREITELDFTKTNGANYMRLLNRPDGLILLTGPTGSGKSSTLYASVRHLNKENINVTTIEDPVELQIEGVNQIQVNAETGLTFAAGLRSVLRQDPNVIMVGEIRDRDTAEIAIRSSLTGHLVLSTLHTNNAIDAIPRLVDMGVEPYLVASSLKGVVAQRLVRRLCMDCRKERKPSQEEMKLYASQGGSVSVVWDAAGCDSCHQTGYKGRLAIHEMVVLDDEIRRLLLMDGSSADFRKYVRSKGVYTLLQDGLLKVKQGRTTITEVMKVAIDV